LQTPSTLAAWSVDVVRQRVTTAVDHLDAHSVPIAEGTDLDQVTAAVAHGIGERFRQQENTVIVRRMPHTQLSTDPPPRRPDLLRTCSEDL
jgi:hypothetical protein